MIARSALFLLFVSALVGCKDPAPDPRKDDVPTKGEVIVLAEEDFRAVLEAEKLIFESIYTDARIRLYYLPQAELLRAMTSDSVRAVFTTCLPGAEQEAAFNTKQLSLAVTPILTDAVVAVVAASRGNKVVPLDVLRMSLMEKGDAHVVFEGQGTGVVRTVVDSLLGGDASSVKHASALPGVDTLVQRVAADPSLIGLLSFATISDLDNPRCKALRSGLVLCDLVPSGEGDGVTPNQSTLADGSYPLRRTLYAVVTEGKSGLGTGFVSFVAGHKGQRIILKSGLAPQRVPAREVMLVN